MTTPARSAQLFLLALSLGAGLGLVYGFLQPFGRRFRQLGDGIFVIALFFSWLYLAFGLCAGDIRLGYTAALALGAVFSHQSLGRLLEPVFSLFWKALAWPWKKIFMIFQKIYKFLLAKIKKWVTMIKTIPKGGAAYGKKEQRQAGASQNQPRHKSRHSGSDRPVAGGTGGSVQLHRPPSRPV